ncbi:MAG: hypothetical protein ABIL44_01025 [candidate division WOR-3 bacterium]
MLQLFIILYEIILAQGNEQTIREDFEGDFQNNWQAISGICEDEIWDIYNGELLKNNPEDILRYIYLKDFFFNEFIAEVDVRLITSYRNGRIGIVFGKGKGHLFLVRVCFDTNTADFRYLVEEPFSWYDIYSSKIKKKLILNNWYRLRIVVEEQRIRFYVDEEMVFDIEHYNYDLIKDGAIGLYCVEGYAAFDNLYAKSLDTILIAQRYGIELLADDLNKLSWRYKYIRNVFNCTNQSAALAIYLKSIGWNAWIAANENHNWVRVETEPGYYIDVEATTLEINWNRPRALAEYYNIEDLIRNNPREYGFPEDCLMIRSK